MKTFDKSLELGFDRDLAQRETELRGQLRPALSEPDAQPMEVTDFKDLAEEELESTVSDAQATHAAHQLEQVLAARQRLREGNYGLCLDCGEAIDLRRLQVMPASAYCATCQTRHEREGRPLAQ